MDQEWVGIFLSMNSEGWLGGSSMNLKELPQDSHQKTRSLFRAGLFTVFQNTEDR